MTDNKKNVGKADKDRINFSEDYEVHDWLKKIGVCHEELNEAVKHAGSMAIDVENYLKKIKK